MGLSQISIQRSEENPFNATRTIVSVTLDCNALASPATTTLTTSADTEVTTSAPSNNPCRMGDNSPSSAMLSSISTTGFVARSMSEIDCAKEETGVGRGQSPQNIAAIPATMKTAMKAVSFSPRVVYGAGAISRLPIEIAKLHLSMPLIVSSPSRIPLARHIQGLIPDLDSHILDSALVNVPQKVVEAAVSRIIGRDCVISIGGASAVDLARAIAINKEIPHICIPTTYSGSETMPLSIDERRGRRKKTQRQSYSWGRKQIQAQAQAQGQTQRPTQRQSQKRARERSCGGTNGSSSGRGSLSIGSSKIGANLDKILPSIIIYDEDLTTTTTSTRISAPDGARAVAGSHHRRSSDGDDAQWAYLHLPGV